MPFSKDLKIDTLKYTKEKKSRKCDLRYQYISSGNEISGDFEFFLFG